MIIPTKRTPGTSTSDIIRRILKRGDSLLKRKDDVKKVDGCV